MSWGSNMYEEYRNRCKIMQKTYKNNLELYNKYKIIEEMLEIPNCFLNMPISTAISIFVDLGYTKEDARMEYIKVTELKNIV